MPKTETKYLTSYKTLLDTFQTEDIPNNIVLSLNEKILLDDLIKIVCRKFIGKNFDERNNLISFNAEDKMMESVLNECSNIGLFSEKKVVVLKNVKKLLKDSKLSLLSYLERFNPDTCLLMVATDEILDVDKIFSLDLKEESGGKDHRKIIDKNVKIYQVGAFTESEMIKWVKKKFEGFTITEDTIKHFLQFTNYSFDEIISEIEKLQTFCYFSNEITKDSVNLCNGIARDFNETDFIKAVIERKKEVALRIYSQISMKKDVEIFLIFLLSSAFVTINKLFDANVSRLQGWQLKKELKLWFPDQEKLLPLYKSFRESINREKIGSAFEYIFTTDKLLKTSGGNKRTMITSLIDNICNL